jgi:hypothetical protein
VAGRMDDYLADCRMVIAEHGWMVQGVFPTVDDHAAPFAYTVGLCQAGLPELVTVGLPAEPATVFLNALARRTLEAEPKVGDRWTVDANPDLVWEFAPVSDRWARENVTMPRRLWPTATVTALQVLWPDRDGYHPNQPGWTLGDAQPLLAIRTEEV